MDFCKWIYSRKNTFRAKESKTPQEFYNKSGKIKNVNPLVSNWFFEKYNPKGGFDMMKAAEKFMIDVSKNVFS